ncbi:hypothetical protein MAPG_05494 [Magnaporthiopsis poae ATCC 64411]|uniref:Uncharacterized protein n=1 Tax=Magnaporthiopsis poae (strain ATCC 64411 / 73-15) TaxID=644358 RepID=A0A0C4DZJ2_MAGP6|nr:hypothetical protein MAPG_05494 [Magnaporthiopsis poae ATCC 64411]
MWMGSGDCYAKNAESFMQPKHSPNLPMGSACTTAEVRSVSGPTRGSNQLQGRPPVRRGLGLLVVWSLMTQRPNKPLTCRVTMRFRIKPPWSPRVLRHFALQNLRQHPERLRVAP